jgi:hypothetical protein
MLPYYLDLNKRIISDELSNTLLEIANRHIDDFIEYKGQNNGELDGNSSLSSFRRPDLFNHFEILKIKKSCILKFYPVFIMHKPNTVVKRHKDDPNHRNSVIITPLFPKANYVPTRFWEEDKNEPVAICRFENFNSALLNTQMQHDLENIDSYRINLQFCFDESFDVVADLYLTGKLFKKQVL